MMNRLVPLVTILVLASCNMRKEKVLYKSDSFTVYSDKVVQGESVAEVISPIHMKSNYRSPASATYSRLIQFKFSINEKDNELAPGVNHWVIIGDEKESPLITFGEETQPVPEGPGTFLDVNYEYTFKVDMTPVTSQFEEKGYYEAFDGTRVAEADFKGFYLAGGSEPMTWDFVNLDNQGFKMDKLEGNIYSLTVFLNPYDQEDYQDKEWKLLLDTSSKPRYESEQPIVDALYNLSLEEAIKNIEPDSTLRTGAKWGGVWTRDISYSIFLAFAYHEPEIARISLMKKVNRDRIIQDTGSGGAWPVSSDRTTWALAAWELYKVTGDQDWLQQAYKIIRNTVEDDFKVIGNTETGMYRGESSFLDWREQSYPKWMSNMDIYVSENLGTNVVHYQTHVILAQMAEILGEPNDIYLQRAEIIKKGINDHLWMEDRGFYAQFLYGRPDLIISPRFEALGEALAILFDVASPERAKEIISRSPLTKFGATCIYPQIPSIPPYHNNGIWPFVQSYWNLAAAKAGNEKVLNHGLASIYRAAGLFLTNYENMVAETGDFLGTEINSDRMLWSMAGNLAMVHRVFMGISFETNGIRFNPVVPKTYAGTKKLSNFKYRNATFNITVEGFGNKIFEVIMDGQKLDDAYFPSDISGEHNLLIKLNNQSFDQAEINLVENHFTLTNPIASLEGDQLNWGEIEGAVSYNVYRNNELLSNQSENSVNIELTSVSEFKVTALDDNGWESFSSEPVWNIPEGRLSIIEIEDYVEKSDLPYTNFEGTGFIEISKDKNREITISIDAEEEGIYYMDMRYSNGSGPWNTDNKCALRSIYVNDIYAASLIFPQRGLDEWSDWGYSNSVQVPLKEGKNILLISFKQWNENMNINVNTAMLDQLRMIRLSSIGPPS